MRYDDNSKIGSEKIDRPLSKLISLNLIFQNINKSLELNFGLSIVQWSLLKKLIEMPASSPLQLSRVLNVTSGTLTQTLARLDKKKLIFICDDPKDARKKMISITRLGKERLDMADWYFQSMFLGVESVISQISDVEEFLRDKTLFRLKEKKELVALRRAAKTFSSKNSLK